VPEALLAMLVLLPPNRLHLRSKPSLEWPLVASPQSLGNFLCLCFVMKCSTAKLSLTIKMNQSEKVWIWTAFPIFFEAILLEKN
jgi:hypothetical protein